MSNWKVGDEVFCIKYGFGLVQSCSSWDTEVDFTGYGTARFLIDGRQHEKSLHPRLFKSPKEASEYFANIKQKKVAKGFLWKDITSGKIIFTSQNMYPDFRFHCKKIKEFEIEYEE